mmetsp:Transcript_5675/g.18553  ORF Transcript_5675/g.18553 Transcript_5675/m.18553 type:complete len:485 (-) Transcript_5675:480-1934(-)
MGARSSGRRSRTGAKTVRTPRCAGRAAALSPAWRVAASRRAVSPSGTSSRPQRRSPSCCSPPLRRRWRRQRRRRARGPISWRRPAGEGAGWAGRRGEGGGGGGGCSGAGGRAGGRAAAGGGCDASHFAQSMDDLWSMTSLEVATPAAREGTRMEARGTAPYSARCTAANPLSEPTTCCSCSSSAASAVSALLMTTTSAVSTCSTSSCTTPVLRASTTSASASAAPRSGRELSRSEDPYSLMKDAASTTVTMFSSLMQRMIGQLSAAASWNMARSSFGSATPDDSTTMCSYGAPRVKESETSSDSEASRSSPAEQQAQPFDSSSMSSPHRFSAPWPSEAPSAAVPPRATSFASMLTAATSLTMTPTRAPSLLLSTCESSVVLPTPRKPDRIVRGMGESSASGSSRLPPSPTPLAPPPPPPALAHAATCSCSGARDACRHRRWTPAAPLGSCPTDWCTRQWSTPAGASSTPASPVFGTVPASWRGC